MTLFPVVILSGGLATRLRPATESFPKAMLAINGEPFVAHQLRLLKKNGIDEVIMCLGYLGEQIVKFVGNGSQFGLRVSYHFDGPVLLGTAGAIKKALSFLPNLFFVLNGDSYLRCHYADVQEAFIKEKKLALMTVFHNQGQWDSSNVEFSNHKILMYDKQKRAPSMMHIDYGLEVFTRDVFAGLPDNQNYDLVTLYQSLINRNQLAAFEVSQRFYENGSFNGISELSAYLSEVRV